jgi:hypothetical protein
MALSHELPIYRDTYKLILGLFELTQHFSKEYKYSLGQDIKRDAICLVTIAIPNIHLTYFYLGALSFTLNTWLKRAGVRFNLMDVNLRK